jgi:hypothetical protein
MKVAFFIVKSSLYHVVQAAQTARTRCTHDTTFFSAWQWAACTRLPKIICAKSQRAEIIKKALTNAAQECKI